MHSYARIQITEKLRKIERLTKQIDILTTIGSPVHAIPTSPSDANMKRGEFFRNTENNSDWTVVGRFIGFTKGGTMNILWMNPQRGVVASTLIGPEFTRRCDLHDERNP